MSLSLTIILVEKNATLKTLTIKDFKESELFKKCGFKKSEDFQKYVEWTCNGYNVSVYGKTNGRANNENKYDFPPPIDTTLFFGSCLLVCQEIKDNGSKEYVSLSIEQWDKFYEKLFGGFENLADTAAEDEEEEDELLAIPSEKKTKQGYLKDDFVVDDDNEGECEEEFSEAEEESETIDDSGSSDELNDDLEGELEDFGSELSEEEYDYDTDSVSE